MLFTTKKLAAIAVSLTLTGASLANQAMAQTVQTIALAPSITLAPSTQVSTGVLTTQTVDVAGATTDTTVDTTKAQSTTKIEGLELLEKLGRYEVPLITYQAAKPSKEQIQERLESAKEFAERAGIKFGEKLMRLEDTRLALTSESDASASFEVDQITGNFLFQAGLEKYGDAGHTPGLPSSGKLERLALQTLEELKLPIDFKELKLEHIGGLNLSIADGKSTPRIYEKLKTVRFSRVLNDVPVMGDARIILQYGDSAELAGLYFQAPKIEAAEKLPPKLIKPTAQLQEQALKELTEMAAKAMRAKLTTVDLVIYDDGKGVMEPAYHIVMERMMDLGTKEPTMIPYDFYLPVSAEPKAFFPHMDVSLFVPEEGRGTKGGNTGTTD